MSEKEQKPVNKKLVIGCSIIIAIAGIYSFIPSKGIESPQKDNQVVQEESKPVKDSNSNVGYVRNTVETPNIINLPTYNSTNKNDITVDNNTYKHSENDILTAKDIGVYTTYKDVSTVNPYYQKYTFSKEVPDLKRNLDDFEMSYYGSLSKKDDYTSTFPSKTN